MSETRQIDDGGPAFPTIHGYVDSFGSLKQKSTGLSLRDHIAISAAPTFLTELYNHSRSVGKEIEGLFRAASAASYEFADAMLAERAKDR